jgi:hypothetical protein
LCLPRKQFVEKHTYLQKQFAKAVTEVVVSEPMALDEPVVESAAVAGANAEAVIQYTQCKHGFVLVQGVVDDTLQPQCTRPFCVRSASVPWEAVELQAAASIQQPDKHLLRCLIRPKSRLTRMMVTLVKTVDLSL